MRRYVWLVLLILIVAGGWYYFHPATDNAGDQAKAGAHKGTGGKSGASVPVGVAAAKASDITIFLSGLGNITPRNTVTVHSRVDGQLMQVGFSEGQLVKAGDLLAQLDARPFDAQLKQAQGQMMRDQALLAEAKLDLARYQTLFKQDSIAKQQVDLQASLVKQYEGAVKNDQGLVDNAKTQVDYTHITAPVSGRVGLRQVDPGNIVHAGDASGIVVVTQLQPITAIFTLPEDSIPSVIKHAAADEQLAAEAWDRESKVKLATGALLAVDNQVDPATGTVKLRAEFTNEDNALFPSQFVNIRLKLETRKNLVTIPAAAVQRGAQGTFVYLVQPDNTVTVRPVTLGPAEGEIASVEKGIEVGDRVVSDGTDTLREGAKIDIAASDGKAAAATPQGDDKANTPPDKGDKEKGPHKHKKHANDADKDK